MVLFIIVTFNAMKWVDRCLTSLEEVKVDHDVFVVDNLSTDGTQDYIKKHYPNVIFYPNKENTGFGAANNIGLQMALDKGYDYVYLLNQDAWIKEGCIEELITVQKKHPEFGILSPVQIQANGKDIDKNFNLNVCSYQANPNFTSDLYFHNLKDVYEVPDIMAAHWLISRECFIKVGGFSPAFKQYGEDNNYNERVRYHGYKIGFVPSAIGIHDRGERGINKNKANYIRYHVGPRILLSSPFKIHKGLLLKCLKDMILYSISHFDWQVTKYFFSFLNNLRKLIQLRKMSISKDCAFLNT